MRSATFLRGAAGRLTALPGRSEAEMSGQELKSQNNLASSCRVKTAARGTSDGKHINSVNSLEVFILQHLVFMTLYTVAQRR